MGECLAEIHDSMPRHAEAAFAGDTFNTAVYLKRCFPSLTSAYVSAVGQDHLSDQMLTMFSREEIDCELVFRHPDKTIGRYHITTDMDGERCFTYDRADSAARTILSFIQPSHISTLCRADVFYFSGISLAVMSPHGLEAFWQLLERVKQSRSKIAFDPNYRALLWPDLATAQDAIRRAFSMADIVLPGLDEMGDLFGEMTPKDVIKFCQAFGPQEVVLKNGPAEVHTLCDGKVLLHRIEPVDQVVDTTSAGDAFNGVYLGSRLSGENVAKAVQNAALMAAKVIQHPGAIIPRQMCQL